MALPPSPARPIARLRLAAAVLATAVVTLSAPHAAHAEREFQSWTGAFGTAGVPGGSRLVLWLDGHARKRDASTQAILRPAVGYRLVPKLVAHLGYAWIPTWPEEGARSDEHRVWQQVVLGGKLARGSSFALRPRLEQRFFDGSDDLGLRARLFMRADYNLGAGSPWLLAATNEVFFHLNDVDGGPSAGFDQNRLFLGLGTRASDGTRAELGVLLQYLNRPTGEDLLAAVLVMNVFVNRRSPPRVDLTRAGCAGGMNAGRPGDVSPSMMPARHALARGALLALSIAACNGGDGTAPTVDAPFDPLIDAAVDAAADAQVDAVPIGPVTVRVARPRRPSPSLPLAGILVFASRLDGSVGERGVTDASGEVTLAVESGGAVTALVSDDGVYRVLSSILAVEPGDVLTIDPQREQLGFTGPGVTYTWPQTPDADGLLFFDAVHINDGCWHRAVITAAPDPPLPPLPTMGTVGLVPGCGPDPRDVAIIHYDPDLARYAFLRGVPAVPGVQPIAAWSLPDTTFTARAVGLPAHVRNYSGVPSPVVHGHSMDGRSASVRPTAGSATHTTRWASAFPAARVLHRISSDVYGVASCYEDAPPGVLDVTLDGADLPAMVGRSAIDPSARRVTWPRSAGADPDEIRVMVNYNGQVQPRVEWTLRAPGTVDDIVVPALPPELAALTLQFGYSQRSQVTFYDLETVTDWRTMRALPFWAAELDAAQSNRWGRACYAKS